MHRIHWSAAVFFLVLCSREEMPCNAHRELSSALCEGHRAALQLPVLLVKR